MRRFLICLLLVAACKGKKPAPGQPPPKSSVASTHVSAQATDAGPLEAPKARGALGPSVPMCEQAADHLQKFVLQQIEAQPEEMKYLTSLLQQKRRDVVEYCLQMAVIPEVQCMIAAEDMNALGDCVRHRRDVGDIPMHKELTDEDCEHFYDRHRQFALERGVPQAEEDGNKDLIVRECLDKGKQGTVTCFIASPTWEQAQQCP